MKKITLLVMILIFIMGCNLPSATIPARESTAIPNSNGQQKPKSVAQPTIETVAPSPAPQKITFSVGPDQAPVYPKSLTIIPDEHTTILPPAPDSDRYLVFAANILTTKELGNGLGGPVVLETKDLKTFTFAADYSSPVMTAPRPISDCKLPFDPEFDLNYAGPGTVVADPTRPTGNLMMIYEAENHCPGGVQEHYFYATVGFARSSDNGKTWPPAVDKELGGPDRYPVLKGSTLEPTVADTNPMNRGDALPSAFVDRNYLYVTYLFAGSGEIRVARAKLGGSGQLEFKKWYNGAFSEPGIGGLDSSVLPSGVCQGENMGQISYNDALGLYMLTFDCKLQGGAQEAWAFSTATSLDRQDWTAPQIIENSQFPVTRPCDASGYGALFDGWYPSFMSPGAAAGHLSKTGFAFFLNGCDAGKRTFDSRAFTITEP